MGRNDPTPDGQDTIRMVDVGFVPTVTEHTEYRDGMRLHTIDPDPDRDIEIFNDDRPPRMVGEAPAE